MHIQRYTLPVNPGVDDKRTFVESGGTSIDAVLMTEDIHHAFALHSPPTTASDAAGDDDDDNVKDADNLSLLLDKILHCPLSDVVRYVSSQLFSFSDNSSDTAADVADNDKEDDDDDEKIRWTTKTSSEVAAARSQHEIGASVQSDTASRTSLASNADHHSQPIRDTEPGWYDVNSCPEDVEITVASGPPEKRLRMTTLDGGTWTDDVIACISPG